MNRLRHTVKIRTSIERALASIKYLFWEQDLRPTLQAWKSLTFRKAIFLPFLIRGSERRIILLLLLASAITGGALGTRIYLRHTTPVPKVGGVYIEGMLREPHTLNPVYASGDADRDISRLVYSQLLVYDGKGELMPDLMDKLETSDDDKIYTVYLKEGIKWHDGESFDADDVVFTIKLIQNSQFKSPFRPNWQGVKVEKIDKYSVRFVLRSPYSQFLENLTLGIIPQHLWKDIDPDRVLLHELNLKPIGTGPYIFHKVTKSEDGTILRIDLKRNRDYHREGPYLETISLNFFKREEELASALRKGKISGYGPLSLELRKPDLEGRTKTYQLAMPRLFGLFFGQSKNQILAQKAIREAIAHGLDRSQISSLVSTNGAIPSHSYLPGPTPKDLKQYLYDPAKSIELLEDAGWSDNDKNGVREKTLKENRQTKKVELRFQLFTSDWPDLVKSAEAVKNSLKDLGIEIDIQSMPFNELEQKIIRTRNFDILLFGQVYGYEPDPFAFWHSSQIKDPGLNITSYINKDTDKILEELRRLKNKEERRKKYDEFQKEISKDIPAIVLYSQLYNYVLSSDLGGVDLEQISLPSDRFNEVNKWFLKTKRALR